MLYNALHQMLVLNKSKVTVKHQKYLIQYTCVYFTLILTADLILTKVRLTVTINGKCSM